MAISKELEPLSLKQTRALLQMLVKSPKKKWGQNFLIDKNIVQKSLELAQLSPHENVIEIGPGLGTLTRPILGKNCRLFAIECDTILYHFLRDTFSNLPRFQIIPGDAVAQPLAGFRNWNEPFKIVSNLPYHISTPWIDAVLEQPALPIAMTLMLQRETALRLLSTHGSKKYSAISIFLTSAYRCVETFPVARTSFSPAPQVDSVLMQLELLPLARIFKPGTKALIRKIFTQRRKQIASPLKIFASKYYEAIAALLRNRGFETSIRPEQLPLAFWHALDELGM
ncbi:MAG: 16S rRNA (adenine(1518)-N(6)/adenine(1519)-N(6))-dimethyltransferase RsmA [Puniceicoccales bacterium]|jgi:16S rRNA (adenine1518-N6/adenine1519-N6)-dimethyltransferase|nr:16S rRNA (adenine(1518)-N(6)/adenine(1519)-N(6))-dimethyltransferase RsmA [Puniceicoccales bacterium]